ncbi:OB-fold domain-containing protein [Salinibacterium sp. SWN167]|nr:OB-fold domain-containing protein [Salinibacterium sp. SWN139]MBH0084024.1 OB-fold domain-containing protein [Salinibacterium sp. SWN167]
MQRCRACSRHFFYPRPICRYCQSSDLEWVTTSGRATLASYIINYRPLPFFETKEPQVIALVDLEEGPRMVCTLIGVEPRPEAISIGMALYVSFEERGDQMLPVFGPVEVRNK